MSEHLRSGVGTILCLEMEWENLVISTHKPDHDMSSLHSNETHINHSSVCDLMEERWEGACLSLLGLS